VIENDSIMVYYNFCTQNCAFITKLSKNVEDVTQLIKLSHNENSYSVHTKRAKGSHAASRLPV